MRNGSRDKEGQHDQPANDKGNQEAESKARYHQAAATRVNR